MVGESLCGGHNLPLLIGIGLTNVPKYGEDHVLETLISNKGGVRSKNLKGPVVIWLAESAHRGSNKVN